LVTSEGFVPISISRFFVGFGGTSEFEVFPEPDGQTIATGSVHDSLVKLWDVQTGQLLRQPFQIVQMSWVVRFSPDGKTLLSGSTDSVQKVWDVIR
jgi:WD40 repeat protein